MISSYFIDLSSPNYKRVPSVSAKILDQVFTDGKSKDCVTLRFGN